MRTRRTFISGALAGSFGGLLGYGQVRRDRTTPNWFKHIAPDSCEFRSLSLILPDIVLTDDGKPLLLNALESRLRESLPASVNLETLSGRQIKQALSSAIRRDYQTGATKEIHGWIVSRTEHLVLNVYARH